MTAQRQYILPNCNLIVEGLVTGDEADPTSPLTVVLNTECTFPGTPDRLSGGREFLNALVKTVSDYAQSLLSGVPYPIATTPTADHPVILQPTEDHRHQLIATLTDANGAEMQQAIALNTVQLFDLVEAVDQLLADAFTLPDMALQVTPLNRRHARPAEPVAQRVIPAAVGVSALAVASVLLFIVPVPEFEPQRSDREEQSELVDPNTTNGADSGAAAPGSDEANDPNAESTSATPDPSADAETDPGTEATSETSELTTSEDVADPVAAGIALGRLSTAPAIADDDLLADLETEVTNTLEAALEDLADDGGLAFDDALIYRIAVSTEGDILGYKYENDAALENVDRTPLPQLTFIPIDVEQAISEPVAQFRLTLQPDGTVELTPVEATDAE
ncbi:DUF4335 domain-containing protein [Leptolyngbya iicbica]|uniref:DUF4335 domain-containing protein n=2 Tax=Cyanophyceae TaxID=3028117 RepID=A0A4Q7E910_9CYAN|nr:DUF4335 domain-containing protein [Leptolyngbya sp. LK]RZM79011.1 DUF4335 domain-containing protein [Leptolyngbya sp. LK]